MDELGQGGFAPTPPPTAAPAAADSGDQIYADEVGHPLISRIVRIAADLIGVDETDVSSGTPPTHRRARARTTRALGFTGSPWRTTLWTLRRVRRDCTC
ncbi:MAG: hypothetical protein WKF76_10300 [Nocardioidaceae bacterium]